MSLYQCDKCGCCENTALSNYHFFKRDEQRLCSACDEQIGKWHGAFDRVFLPLGMFRTDAKGNLAHKKTGDTDFEKYAVQPNAGVERHPQGVRSDD